MIDSALLQEKNLWKYLKNTESNLYLTIEENAWLSEHGTIRVGYQDGYLAFCAKDKDSGDLMFEVSGTPVDVEHGKMMLYVTPAYSSIPVGDYITDIQITTADGHVNTIFPPNVNQVGTFRITQQVTEG